MTVLAAYKWPSNAFLIEDCATLGYLQPDWKIVDVTYGLGTWWKRWRPNNLAVHDIALDGIDFRDLPYEDGTFDVVAYDPPYVSVGGRRTSGMQSMYDRFGLLTAARTPADLQLVINAGLIEAYRVVKDGGYVLCKCADYVSSGKLWLGTHNTLTCALAIGFECVDRFEHVGRPRPQPVRRRQVHARRNLSTLFVLRK